MVMDTQAESWLKACVLGGTFKDVKNEICTLWAQSLQDPCGLSNITSSRPSMSIAHMFLCILSTLTTVMPVDISPFSGGSIGEDQSAWTELQNDKNMIVRLWFILRECTSVVSLMQPYSMDCFWMIFYQYYLYLFFLYISNYNPYCQKVLFLIWMPTCALWYVT